MEDCVAYQYVLVCLLPLLMHDWISTTRDWASFVRCLCMTCIVMGVWIELCLAFWPSVPSMSVFSVDWIAQKGGLQLGLRIGCAVWRPCTTTMPGCDDWIPGPCLISSHRWCWYHRFWAKACLQISFEVVTRLQCIMLSVCISKSYFVQSSVHTCISCL